MNEKAAGRMFRFGIFEADEASGELRKQGRRLSLQGQPLQVLFILVSRPGETITRTEIQQRLWPDGVFVDFDHSLNTAINKVREALGDSATSPRFVETLARRGYRFIAPVEVVDFHPNAPERVGDSAAAFPGPEPPPASPPAESAAPTVATASSQTLLTTADEVPRASGNVVRWLFLLLQVMYLSFYVVALGRLGEVAVALHAIGAYARWIMALLILTAVVGIPTRLYLLATVAFKAPDASRKFRRLFPLTLPLDQLWALAPFLLAEDIGLGLALAATAALLYAPFAQRSLVLMGAAGAGNSPPRPVN